MSGPSGLKLLSFVPGTGYGDAALEYLAGLDGLGVPVTWSVISPTSQGRAARRWSRSHVNRAIVDRVEGLWRRRLAYDAFLLSQPPPDFHRRWRRKERHARAFAYAAWELECLPDSWPPAFADFERVFVPSEFNRKAFEAAGVPVPVDVVPHVARSIAPVSGRLECVDLDDEVFAFYTYGPWTTRKALDETVRAYLDAFEAGEKVALVVKTDPLDHVAFAAMTPRERRRAPKHLATTWWALARILGEYPRPAAVHLVARGVSALEIDRLHTRGDCFVSLTRGEGWGLGAFDAALFGNPVVVTGWGGQLEYLGSDYPYLVDYRIGSTGESPPDECTPRGPGYAWAHARREHASALMRRVFERRDEARAVASARQAELRARFAPDAVCRRLAELMGFDPVPGGRG